MAGSFNLGPIVPPGVRVEQIFRLTQALPVNAGLPLVVIGLNRHVEFEELLGTYTGGASDTVLPITSLAAFPGIVIDSLDPISYVDSEDGLTKSTVALPHVFMRHSLYGDIDIEAGSAGYTIDNSTGALTVDNALSVDVTAVSSAAGSYTAWGDPNDGRRTFTDLTADFLDSGVEVGDQIYLNGVAVFTIVQVLNQTQVVVEDAVALVIDPNEAITSAEVTYTIIKTLTGTDLSGPVYITYAATRIDRQNELINISTNTIEDEIGEASILNPLALACLVGLNNTATDVMAIQLASDDVAGHTAALEVLANYEQPYNLVPLNQSAAILALYQTHVDQQSDPDVGHERRLWQSKTVDVETEKANNTSSTFDVPNKTSASAIQFTVGAGGSNIQTFGVTQGDLITDETPGFSGSARIVSVTPTGGDDDPVNVVLATPNTLGSTGTQASMTVQPLVTATATQTGAAQIDVAGALAAETVTVRGQTFIKGTHWSNAATLITALQAAFEGCLVVTAGAGSIVEIETVRGGYTNTLLGTEGYTISDTVTGGSWLALGGGALAIAGQMDITGATAGIRDGETFSIRDQAGTLVVFEFDSEQVLTNGALGDGSTVTANRVCVAIGGPVMTPTEVRDQIIAAINRKLHSGLFTASENAVVPLVTVTADVTGLVGSTAATGNVTATSAAQEGAAQIDTTAAVNTNTVTINGTVFEKKAAIVGATDWVTLADLVSAINNNIPNVLAADAGANILTVRTTTYGWTMAQLLVAFPLLATMGGPATWERLGGGGGLVAQLTTAGTAVAGVMDGETFILEDGINPAVVFEFDRNGSVTPGNVAISVVNATSATILGDLIENAINSAAALDITAVNAVGVVSLTNDTAGTVGNIAIVETVTAGMTATGMAGGVNGSMVGTDSVVNAGFVMTSVTSGTGAIGGSPLTVWSIGTNPLTTDQWATAVAQVPQAISNRRVSNVWPQSADMIFTDVSGGETGDLENKGIFGGVDVVIVRAPGYYACAASGARRSGINPALPLTSRPLAGVYNLRDVKDTFTSRQLLRILSTGNVLMEQVGGIGASISQIRGVTTDVTDLKLSEENVTTQVDAFAKDLRLTCRPLFGPNVIDPDGNFFNAFSVKVQSVINYYITNGRAKSITIRAVYEDPDRKDHVILELDYEPLFGANLGTIRIYI